MTKPYRLSIQQFIHHFQHQGVMIGDVASELHRKILYASALDPLARAVYGKSGDHRARLVNLVALQTDWSDANRISLFQLSLHLRAKGRTRFRLYREVKRQLDGSPPQRRILLKDSPQKEDLIFYTAHKEELEALERHSYKHLFYTYRNNLIHEYREPGYGHDWSRRGTEPFYTSLSSFGKRELVFPVAFFASLYEQALTGVERFLLSQKVNPHDKFAFGSYWEAR